MHCILLCTTCVCVCVRVCRLLPFRRLLTSTEHFRQTTSTESVATLPIWLVRRDGEVLFRRHRSKWNRKWQQYQLTCKRWRSPRTGRGTWSDAPCRRALWATRQWPDTNGLITHAPNSTTSRNHCWPCTGRPTKAIIISNNIHMNNKIICYITQGTVYRDVLFRYLFHTPSKRKNPYLNCNFYTWV